MSVRIFLLICFIVFAPPAFSQVATFDGGSVYDLDPKAEQSTSNHILEQMLDNDDMQAISELSPTDVIRVLAKPVGRLTLEFEKESSSLRPRGAYCTASLIGRDLIITNYHCIPGKGNISNALLTMGYLKPRTRRGVAQYPVRLEPVESSEELDYSILRVEGNPGDEWGTITLSGQTPEALNTLFVVHHPGGFPQYVTRGRCQTNDPAIDGNDMLHKCDTLPGSSGAPIFDNNTRKVVGLHYSAVALRGLNAGKRIASIAKDSPLIGKMIESSGEDVEAPRSEPPLSEAAQAWRVVQDTQSEAVLEEYVRRFPESVYAGFARARLEELRRQKVAVGITEPSSASCDGVEVSLGTGGSTCIKPGSGASFNDCPDCPEMVVVPAGSFDMGSPRAELNREEDEDDTPGDGGLPVRVEIGRPFAVGKFALMRGEFAEFMSSSGHKADGCYISTGGSWKSDDSKSWRDPGFTQDKDHPVVCVSWYDATAYVAWLSKKTGKFYRLLTESEWEYSARARKQTPFWWGASISSAQANYDGYYTYGGGSKGEFRRKTVPVNSFEPNPWGLYQVHGNVWEWAQDCYGKSYKDTPRDGGAANETSGCARVLRGGSWNDFPYWLRSANRSRITPDFRSFFNGFRIARTL